MAAQKTTTASRRRTRATLKQAFDARDQQIIALKEALAHKDIALKRCDESIQAQNDHIRELTHSLEAVRALADQVNPNTDSEKVAELRESLDSNTRYGLELEARNKNLGNQVSELTKRLAGRDADVTALKGEIIIREATIARQAGYIDRTREDDAIREGATQDVVGVVSREVRRAGPMSYTFPTPGDDYYAAHAVPMASRERKNWFDR